MLPLSVSVVVGWLLGSVPVAYLVVRRSRGIDITRAGSANVGANNAFRTTGSHAVGVTVLALDALKGAGAVGLGWLVASILADVPDPALARMCAAGGLAGAVAGHNYNLPLTLATGRLAGGKGLATAAGGLMAFTPLLVPKWLALWAIGFWAFAWLRGVRDVIPGNVFATLFIPLGAWVFYGLHGLYVVSLLAALVLPKHVHQMRSLLSAPQAVHDALAKTTTSPPNGLQESVKPADTGR